MWGLTANTGSTSDPNHQYNVITMSVGAHSSENYVAPFEFGAATVTTMTFSSGGEEQQRTAAFNALCSLFVKARFETEPKWSEQFPQYADIDDRTCKASLRTFSRRLRDRTLLGRDSLGYLGEAIRHLGVALRDACPERSAEIGTIEIQSAILGKGMSRHSLNQLGARDARTDDADAIRNWERRVWDAGIPVVHIAAAWHVLGKHLNFDTDFVYSLEDLALHRRILSLAQFHEAAIDFEWHRRIGGGQGSSTFLIDPSRLIRLRPISANPACPS